MRQIRTSAFVVAAAAVLLTGCSGGDTGAAAPTGGSQPTPAPSASTSASVSASASAAAGSAAGLAAQFLDGQKPPESQAPLATADAELGVFQSDPTPATAGVVSVVANARRTVLHWQLSTEIAGAQLWPMPPFNRTGTSANTYDVELQDAAGARYHPVKRPESSECLCSSLYYGDLGPTPYGLYAIYPPLPPDATRVTVRIPHFDPMNVAITRV